MLSGTTEGGSLSSSMASSVASSVADRAVPIGYQCALYVQPGSSTTSIAEKFHIDEKILRRANKNVMVDVDEKGTYYPNVRTRMIIPAKRVTQKTQSLCAMELVRMPDPPTPKLSGKREDDDEENVTPTMTPMWCTVSTSVSLPSDVLMSCGSHGKCREENGKCACDEGYKGSLCRDRKCPLDCNLRHSTCNLKEGRCDCDYGWEGNDCSKTIPLVPHNGGPATSATDIFTKVYQEESLKKAAAAEGEDSSEIAAYLDNLARRAAASSTMTKTKTSSRDTERNRKSHEEREVESIKKELKRIQEDDEKQRSSVQRAKDALDILRGAADDAYRSSRERGSSATMSLMRTKSNSERVESAKEAMSTLRELAMRSGSAAPATVKEMLRLEDASNLLSRTAEMSLDEALVRSKRCPMDCSR